MGFDLEEILEEFSASTGGRREFFGEGYSLGGASHRKRRKTRDAERYELRVTIREANAKLAETWRCSCGAELRDDPHQRGPRKRHCSMRCYQRDYMRERRAGTQQPRPLFRCGACGDVTQRSKKGGPPKKWCSAACAQRAYLDRKSEPAREAA